LHCAAVDVFAAFIFSPLALYERLFLFGHHESCYDGSCFMFS
jgi:hypothetical protein